MELLHGLVPTATAIGFPVNPTTPGSQSVTSDVQAAARVLGLQLHVENTSNDRDIDAAFASFVQQRVNALFVAGDGALVDPQSEGWSRCIASGPWPKRLAEHVGCFSDVDSNQLVGP